MTALKAYLVTDGDECSEVVFASSPGKAKMIPDWWCDVDFVDLRATRAPAFDDIEGEITARHYLERDMCVGCGYCEIRIDAEQEGLCYDESDTAFCCEDHRTKLAEIHARYQAKGGSPAVRF